MHLYYNINSASSLPNGTHDNMILRYFKDVFSRILYSDRVVILTFGLYFVTISSSLSNGSTSLANLLTFSSTPSSTIAFTHNEAMPIAASPAPANTNVESAKLRLVIRLDAYNPATATAAVP
uniref:Uncharacterized protein n=1 Tax=Glossina pallidipes TaxID=7398 RepID=A0A1A9ZZ07_GLOPL